MKSEIRSSRVRTRTPATAPAPKVPTVGEIRVINTVKETVNATEIFTTEEASKAWVDGPMASSWYDSQKEAVVVLHLNLHKRLMGFSLISLGTDRECLCGVKEVFRPLVASGCSSFVLMHNHPTGDVRPSQPDLSTTKLILDASRLLGIKMDDHIIISGSIQPSPRYTLGVDYYSFKHTGIVP